jgi:hypothetical protein
MNYKATNIVNPKDFSNELRNIENNQSLSFFDRAKAKKQLINTYLAAKQKEIDGHLDTFEKFLLAKKDVETKAITQEAQKAIMKIENENLKVMQDLGLSQAVEMAGTLIKSGTMLTEKLKEVKKSTMTPEIKKITMDQIREIWNKTNTRIRDSVDTYMTELTEKERNKDIF